MIVGNCVGVFAVLALKAAAASVFAALRVLHVRMVRCMFHCTRIVLKRRLRRDLIAFTMTAVPYS